MSIQPDRWAKSIYACLFRISLTLVTVLAGFWVRHSLPCQ